jgi:GNAT superfamily N-acetyltransferase
MKAGDAATFAAVDPAGADAQAALRSYLAEIAARIPGGATGPDDADAVDDYRPPGGVFLLARSGDAVVGCGAVRALGPGVGELKRMWIDPARRGQGLGRGLLEALETAARDLGYVRVRLDTHEVLVEAVRLYEGHGYRPIDRYHDFPDPTHFFEKALIEPGSVPPG